MEEEVFRWKCLLQKPVATSGYVVNKVNGQDEFEVRLFEFSARAVVRIFLCLN